jgi:hypothetical protein
MSFVSAIINNSLIAGKQTIVRSMLTRIHILAPQRLSAVWQQATTSRGSASCHGPDSFIEPPFFTVTLICVKRITSDGFHSIKFGLQTLKLVFEVDS